MGSARLRGAFGLATRLASFISCSIYLPDFFLGQLCRHYVARQVLRRHAPQCAWCAWIRSASGVLPIGEEAFSAATSSASF